VAAVRAAVVCVALGVWWMVAALKIWPTIFVPSPGAVWDQLIRTSTSHDGVRGYSGWYLYQHVWASMRRILLGSGVAIAVGVPLGLALGSSRWLRVAAEPAVTFVRSLPPLAYFSLLIIWFGIDETPKVVLLFLAAMPPVVVATADAVRNVPVDRLLALRSLGANGVQVLRHGVLPSILPELMTGVRVSVAFAFTTVVAAETVNGMPGIGGMVRDAQRFNQTDVVVLGIIVIGLCGILLDSIVKLADRVLVPWRGKA
jgi:taurine transport system permease protein